MKISIIILNYNGGNYLLDCVNSVLRLEKQDNQVFTVVVDNHSTDGSLKLLRSLPIKIITNHKNLGFAAGNNVGLRYALENQADMVFLLNNDTTVKEDAVIQLIKVAQADKKIGLLGSKIYFYPGCEFHQQRYRQDDSGKVIWFAGGRIDWQNLLILHRGVDEVDRGQYNQIEKTEFVSGCALMIKREVLEKVGLFEEKYFLYFEDIDFCLKAQKAGFKIFFVPTSIVWHKNQSTSTTGSDRQDYYMVRNRLLFGFRWAPLRTKVALIKESLSVFFKSSVGRQKGILDFYLRKFGQGPNL